MKHEYWFEAWEKQEFGFDQLEPNKDMIAFFSSIENPDDKTVFVPLCGRSIDMIWLREQGFSVIGVELSTIAVDSFFEKHALSHTKENIGDFTCYQADKITIFCGDFFQLMPGMFSAVDFIYDRAAFFALPVDMRYQYATHLQHFFSGATQLLLISINYKSSQPIVRPPFPTSNEEICNFYDEKYNITRISQQEVTQIPERFIERGMYWLEESIYIILKDG